MTDVENVDADDVTWEPVTGGIQFAIVPLPDGTALVVDLEDAKWEPEVRYEGGPCPDPLRCAYRWRFASGPWACYSNHPHAP